MEDNAVMGGAQAWADDAAYLPPAVGELDPKALFSEDALRAIVRDPRFRDVAEALAAEASTNFQGLDAASRWLLKDLGRTAIYVGAFALYAFLGTLTQSGLIAALTASGVASRSRVISFVDRAIATGRLGMSPGPLPWTQRPLTPRPVFVEVLRDLLAGGLRAIGPIDPTVALAARSLSNDRTVAAAYVTLGRTSGAMRSLGAPPLPRIEFFMQRDGGLKVLQELLLDQDPGRARLLEDTRLSKTDIARRSGVSRIHLNTLLEDAEAAGLLTRVGRSRIVFDRALSDSYELWVAIQIQGARLIAETILAHET